MPNISDRRKLSMSRNIALDDDSLIRTNTNKTKAAIDTPPSSHDMRKVVKELETMLKEERMKRIQLEEHMQLNQKRTILREREFYQILQSTHKEVNKYLKNANSKTASTADEVLTIFQSIFDKFEQSNEATNMFIEKRYRDNLGMMQRRIFQILDTFGVQINKNKKLSDESYRNIRSEIQKMVVLAQNFQDQNTSLQKQLDNALFKNKVLAEQKELLIKQVVQKKKLINMLYHERKGFTKEKKIFKTNQAITIQPQNTSVQLVPKFLCEPSIDVSDFKPSTSLCLKTKINSRVTTVSHKNSNTKNFTKSMNLSKKAPVTQSNEKVIEHLKICLAREKKRVYDLGKIVTKIQSKNDEINEVISEAFMKAKTEGSDKTSIQVLLQCQKLFSTIRELKKRLSVCEKPAINCGWGEVDTSQLLSTQIDI